MTTGPATGWVAETASRPHHQFAGARRTLVPRGRALRDAGGDAGAAGGLPRSIIDEWIASEVEQVFAVQEGAAFVNGDGTNKPKGFLQYDQGRGSVLVLDQVSASSRPALDAGFPADGPADPLIDLVYALKAGYRQNAHFVMNRKTQSAIRKLKDADDNYLWQPPAQVGGRAGLLTFPVVEAEEMPDIAADSYSIAFGDFNARLSRGRPPGRAGAARSVFRQALCAVLHHQARRRRRAGFRRDQAAEVLRGVASRVRCCARRAVRSSSSRSGCCARDTAGRGKGPRFRGDERRDRAPTPATSSKIAPIVTTT